MIVCLCRGVSDREINRRIDEGATTLRDLQRCGIGDQCGSCNSTLRNMLMRAAEARAAAPACVCGEAAPAVAAHA
ncbi:MAG TPA: (2Fe-2S)-binding protein [Thermoanaerobaculia bacterium]